MFNLKEVRKMARINHFYWSRVIVSAYVTAYTNWCKFSHICSSIVCGENNGVSFLTHVDQQHPHASSWQERTIFQVVFHSASFSRTTDGRWLPCVFRCATDVRMCSRKAAKGPTKNPFPHRCVIKGIFIHITEHCRHTWWGRGWFSAENISVTSNCRTNERRKLHVSSSF